LLFLSFFYTFKLCMIVVSMHSFDVLILSYKHDSISYKCVWNKVAVGGVLE
jgi:hypothetical protein